MSRTFVFYHTNCTDGTAAAYCAWRAFGNTATYRGVQYRQSFPEGVEAGDNVYLLDFCYPVEVLEDLVKRGVYITICDHHKTIEDTFKYLTATYPSQVRGVFDVEKSGAVLAWEMFFPIMPMPKLFKFIQDRDLWKGEFPLTEDIITGIRSIQDIDKFEVFDRLIFDPSYKGRLDYETFVLDDLMFRGRILNEQRGLRIAKFADPKMKRYMLVDLHGYKTAIYNGEIDLSDTCNAILKNGTGIDIAISYFVTSDEEQVFTTVFSLRSLSDGSNVDVSAICKKYGGGGHHNAAAFSVKGADGLAFLAAMLNNKYIES